MRTFFPEAIAVAIGWRRRQSLSDSFEVGCQHKATAAAAASFLNLFEFVVVVVDRSEQEQHQAASRQTPMTTDEME